MNDVNDGCSATGERITVNIFSLQGRSPRSPTVRAPDRRYGGHGFDSYPNVITARQTTEEPRNRLTKHFVPFLFSCKGKCQAFLFCCVD